MEKNVFQKPMWLTFFVRFYPQMSTQILNLFFSKTNCWTFFCSSFFKLKPNIKKKILINIGGLYISEIEFIAPDLANFLPILNNKKVFLNTTIFSNQSELRRFHH